MTKWKETNLGLRLGLEDSGSSACCVGKDLSVDPRSHSQEQTDQKIY